MCLTGFDIAFIACSRESLTACQQSCRTYDPPLRRANQPQYRSSSARAVNKSPGPQRILLESRSTTRPSWVNSSFVRCLASAGAHTRAMRFCSLHEGMQPGARNLDSEVGRVPSSLLPCFQSKLLLLLMIWRILGRALMLAGRGLAMITHREIRQAHTQQLNRFRCGELCLRSLLAGGHASPLLRWMEAPRIALNHMRMVRA